MSADCLGESGIAPLLGARPAVALYGWGQKGHRIVGDIAQERLTEVTKRHVHSLIGNKTLASVANWADQIRPLAVITLKIPLQPPRSAAN